MTFAIVLPYGALLIAFLAVALPVVLLMAVWSGVMMYRILFPERPLPFEAAGRRQRAVRRGEAVPVRLRDILEDQALRAETPADPAAGAPPRSEPHPFADDLWARRN